ncbi:unnamed protein product, partial [Coregonus sp. 'balchen']
GKKYERLNIVLLTDLNSQSSPDQLDIIIGSLKRAGITLQFMYGGGSSPPHGGKGLSREQQQGLEMTKQVCEERPRKSWSVVDAQTHQKDDVKRDVVYCLNDDEETEVQKDDTIQGESALTSS